MEYCVITDVQDTTTGSIIALEKLVNLHISLGWKPIGGISVSSYIACQAMVKEEDE